MSSRRIVSLFPAATEMVFALGAGDRLVARSHECDFPWEATRLPAVTTVGLDSSVPASRIHKIVQASKAAGHSLYRIDANRLRALKPDLILTQAQCSVCAVSLAELDAAWGNEVKLVPEILALAPNRFADLWLDLRRVARALELPDEGRSVIARLKSRVVDVIEHNVSRVAPRAVACLEWLDPLMGAGNWIPELVELAGGRSVLGQSAVHSGEITIAQLVAADPEVIVGLPCGFELERTHAELLACLKSSGWSELRAVREGQVYAVDGNAYFNRPGPRLVDSLELLAELLQPDRYPKPQFEGKGWRKVALG